MPSRQKQVLSAVAERLNAGRQDIEEFFTEDFVLHQPGAAALPTGHAGARAMAEGFQGLKLAILDMVEEDDRVAVRWAFSGARDGAAIEAACVAVYRFARGRIAEDWGVALRAPWP